jgi:hypothetical protein
MEAQKILRIESSDLRNRFCCPFCGHTPFDFNIIDDQAACEHALFAAIDEGFGFRSARFDRLVVEQGIADEDESGFNGYDWMTDELALAGAVKFIQYGHVPRNEAAYFGFAPI